VQGRVHDTVKHQVGMICFTQNGDDLSQWRAYGSGEGGYVFEFDSVYLRGMSHSEQIILGQIEYNKTQQDAFLDDLLKHTISFFLAGLQKNRAYYRRVAFRIYIMLAMACCGVCSIHKAPHIL
jgi:hypothetical protein